MSLQVEDPRSRGRSRSQSRHRDSDSKHKRDKSTGPAIVSADPRGSSSGLPYPMYPGGGSSESSYVRPPSPPGTGYYTRPNADHTNMPGSYAMSGGLGPAPANYASSTASYSAHPSGSGYTGTSPPASYAEFDPKISSPKGVASPGGVLDNLTSFLPAKYASQFVGDEEEKERKKAKKAAKKVAKAEKLEDDLAYGSYVPQVQDMVSSVTSVDPPAEVAPGYGKPQYSRASEDVRYDVDSAPPLPPRYGNTLSPTDGRDEENRSSSRHRSNSSSSRKEYKFSYEKYSEDPRSSNPSVVTIEPGKSSRQERAKSKERRRETLPPRRDDSRERSRLRAESSPQPPSGRLSLLTVQTPHHGASLSLSSAPPSPMLEAYHGTYQAMSPMPSPIMGPSMGPDGYYPTSPGGRFYSSSDDDDDFKSPTSPRFERRARFHNAADDARKIAEALRGKKPDVRPLIEILPGMTHDQIMELRQEYKRIVTTGPQKLGVNIAKHIRSKLKDEDSSLMKACYATALGRWESEAYWANFWYQGDKTRRELLIEALMGRTNAEIKEIRRGFYDKKYDNSLSRCMRTELKEDKFKKAVMMVLDENRMEDWDIRNGRPMKIDRDLVEEDVKALHKAVRSTKGGETTMLTIVVTRSDGHLKEVMRQYEKAYKSNFAKEALKKSGNLVGEVLAHILNGVINKPLRDAMLVNHALSLSRRDDLKRELLISRLVRYHWDREHMKAVKRCYRERYGKDMQDAVAKEVGDKDWGHFCEQLCVSRMPGSIRQVERVEIISDRRRD